MAISFENINHILVQEDIEGFIEAGAPQDEYEYEAKRFFDAINLLSAKERDKDHLLAAIVLIWFESFEISQEEMKLRLQGLERVVDHILAL